MYKVEFVLDSFSSDLASSSESFRIAGTRRVRVKQDPDSYEGQLDRRDYFVAKSRGPFVVVITTHADGGNSHLDGVTTILVATKEDGGTGASVFAAMGDFRNHHRLAPVETAAV